MPSTKKDRRGPKKAAAASPDASRRSGSDRRRMPRILIDLEVDYSSEETFLFAYITDMSAMGIFVRTNNPEPIGTNLNLRFTLPGDHKPLAVEGTVTWINPYRPGDPTNLNPGMGVRFVSLNDEEKEKIVDLIRKIAYLEGTPLDENDASEEFDDSAATSPAEKRKAESEENSGEEFDPRALSSMLN